MRPVSVQKIRAILKAAGATFSESSPTAVKGWRIHSPGYVVRKDLDGAVRIAYETGDHQPTGDRERRRLNATLKVLDAYSVVYEWAEGMPALVCKGIAESERS